MKLIPWIIAFLVGWAMTVCSQTVFAEDIVKRTIAISDVTQLKMEGGGKLTIEYGETESLELIGPRSALDKIRVDATGNLLRVKHKNAFFGWANGDMLEYHLVMNKLSSLDLRGNLQVEVRMPVTTDNFTVRATGAPKIHFDQINATGEIELSLTGAAEFVAALSASKLTVHSTGASRITLEGQAQVQDIRLSGAVDYNGFNLHSDRVETHLSGASNAKLWVDKNLEVNLSGSGEIKYYGHADVFSKISGVGKLKHLGDAPLLTH